MPPKKPPRKKIQAVRAQVERVKQDGTRFPIIASVCRLLADEIAIDDRVIEVASEVLEVEADHLRSVARWVDSLLATEESTPRPLYFCKSVSCNANGAAELHAWLEPELRRLGCKIPFEAVHCLNQCEDGPSIGFCDEIFVGREERIAVDERGWRPDPMTEGQG